ncbi:TPA: hypothetical protein ACGUPU_001708 [Vibrio vulnificus]
MSDKPSVKELSDDDLVIINNILVTEIVKLKAQLDEVTPEDVESKGLGEISFKELIAMYKEHQEEISYRGLKK